VQGRRATVTAGTNRGAAAAGRRARAGFLAMLLAFALPFGPAAAQLLPTGFFDHSPTPGAQAEIEADFLTYNAQTTVISAEGGFVTLYDGYEIAADRLSYNQTTGEMLAEGNVKQRDPEGNYYEADRIEVTDSMKRAF